MKEYKFHPISEAFPAMREYEYESLKESIKTSGLLNPIWIHEGKILDGRQRYKACLELKIEPQYQIYTGNDPVSFVRIQNAERRQLTKGQLACSVAILAKLQRKDPLQNLKYKGNIENFKGKKEKDINKNTRDYNNRTTTILSKAFGIGSNTVMKAAVLMNNDKKLFNEVFEGKKTVTNGYNYFREKTGTVKKPMVETVANLNKFKEVIKIPDCFASREDVEKFCDSMNDNGWILEIRRKYRRFYAHWYGNGFASVHTSWSHLKPEFEYKRAVIVAAKEKLDKVKNQQLKAA